MRFLKPTRRRRPEGADPKGAVAVAERTGKKGQVLMFNIFRRRSARNDPGGTQPADVTEDSNWGHTLYLLASGGAGVEGTWQEN